MRRGELAVAGHAPGRELLRIELYLSNMRSTVFIREFTWKIGFAGLSAEGSTIRR